MKKNVNDIYQLRPPVFLVAPTVHVENQLIGAPLDTSVELNCFSEGHPRTIRYWNLGKSMLLSNSKYVQKETNSEYNSSMTLIINSVSQEDYGTYKCVVENSLGTASGTIQLYRK